MTKTLLSAALIAGLGIAAFAPQAASASDGTINFTGRVTSATCTIKINNGNANAAITLPTVQKSDLSAVNSSAGYTAVTIALGGPCAAGSDAPNSPVTSVVPYFEQGPNTNLSTGNLLNAVGATYATKVEVMLSLSNDATVGNKLNLAAGVGAQNAGPAQLISGTPTFTYYAAYVSPNGGATAGLVSTSVQYDLSYN